MRPIMRCDEIGMPRCFHYEKVQCHEFVRYFLRRADVGGSNVLYGKLVRDYVDPAYVPEILRAI
jgi:hypothetical protein